MVACAERFSALATHSMGMFCEGTQIREIEEVTEVEQLLLNGHKKSDTRGLVSDFLEAPAWTQMLK